MNDDLLHASLADGLAAAYKRIADLEREVARLETEAAELRAQTGGVYARTCPAKEGWPAEPPEPTTPET